MSIWPLRVLVTIVGLLSGALSAAESEMLASNPEIRMKNSPKRGMRAWPHGLFLGTGP